MTTDTVIEVAGLTKRYGGVAVVDALDLEVRQGEILGIVGANGAGKTTAVECIQGLRIADAGTIRICGLDPIADRSRLMGRLGSQLQHAALPDRLRVAEAISLFSGPSAAPVDEILETWGLTAQRRSAFAVLSGGQQQRLFVALALLNDPDVVFLDELTQGLDPAARRVVWGLVDQLRESGTTVVLVTHFLDEAEALCDRVAVIRSGRVVALGRPADLIAEHGTAAEIRFTMPGGLTVEDVEALPGLTTFERHGERATLRGDRTLVAHAGAALVASGTVPDDLQVLQPSLESVLLPMIGTDKW